MISRETLRKIAKLNNMRPWQQEKHYIQSIVLVALSEYPVVFKGGTYLWFFHGLDRFSDDLDFTAAGQLPEDLDEDVSESLRLFGIENSIRRSNGTAAGISFRISANGPLHTSERDRCHVYIEISEREKVLRPTLSIEASFDAYGLPVKMLSGMALDEVAAEKVRAIMTRDKARDLYDFAFLLRKKGPRPSLEMVDEKLRYYDMAFSKEAFWKKLAEKKASWDAELKPLVFKDLGDFEAAAGIAADWART